MTVQSTVEIPKSFYFWKVSYLDFWFPVLFCISNLHVLCFTFHFLYLSFSNPFSCSPVFHQLISSCSSFVFPSLFVSSMHLLLLIPPCSFPSKFMQSIREQSRSTPNTFLLSSAMSSSKETEKKIPERMKNGQPFCLQHSFCLLSRNIRKKTCARNLNW